MKAAQSAIVLEVSQLEWPVDWPALFERDKPLIVEIGFGNGDFLLEMANQRSDHNLIGVEISLPSLRRGERKIEQAGLAHVKLVRAPAQVALWLLFKPDAIQEVHINFPDPWPKAAHHRRRLINARFLKIMASRLREGGLVNIATDHDEYGIWILERLQGSRYFEPIDDKTFVSATRSRLRTKYESKAVAVGKSSVYFHWKRVCSQETERSPILKESPMPHARIDLPMSLEDIDHKLGQLSIVKEGRTVRLGERFLSTTRRMLLIDAYTADGPYEQRIQVAISQRDRDSYLIGLHEMGYPRPTPSVILGLRALTQALMALHPEAHLRSQNIGLDSRADESR